MELSKVLNTKINLLDNKALVEGRIKEAEKDFSVKALNKYELKKFIGKTGKALFSENPDHVMGMIQSALVLFTNDPEIVPVKRDDFGNKYLETCLNRLHYVENYDYTIGEIGADINMSMLSGLFLVTINKKKSEELKKVDSNFWSHLKTKVNRVDTGKVVIFNYTIKTKNEFDFILNKFMSLDIKPNIFEK